MTTDSDNITADEWAKIGQDAARAAMAHVAVGNIHMGAKLLEISKHAGDQEIALRQLRPPSAPAPTAEQIPA